MKPFLMRYGQSQSRATEEGARNVRYSTHDEVSVFTDDWSLAIECRDLGVNSTGTLITRAQIDPTRDESTDR